MPRVIRDLDVVPEQGMHGYAYMSALETGCTPWGRQLAAQICFILRFGMPEKVYGVDDAPVCGLRGGK